MLFDSKISGNKKGGVFVGKGVQVPIVGTDITDNGGYGVYYEGESLMDRLGLPKDTDPKELAAVLAKLWKTPEAERGAALEATGFWKKLAGVVVNATTVAANIVAIVAQADILEVIANLLA